MRVKNINISIKNDEDIFKEVKEVWDKIEKGMKVKKHKGILFENPEDMRKFIDDYLQKTP